MNKKAWLGFVVVFIAAEILNFLINGVLMMSDFQSVKHLWRPDMMDMLWIYHVHTLISSFFFTLIFIKGYEGNGIPEGLRFGFYIGIWISAGTAFGTYGMIAIPASLAIKWFILGVVNFVILGLVLALVVGKKPNNPADKG